MSSDRRSVTLDGEEIQFTVRESSDATEPRIDVGIHDVTVVVPAGVDMDPERLLLDNLDWVREKKAKYDRYLDEAPERRFQEGEEFPYLGEPHEVMVERRSASDVEDGSIRLARHHVEQTSIKQALERSYRREAREVIEEAVNHYAPEMNVEHDQLEIRNQRTKWGSCSSSGTLGINWRLIMAPREILEYVVIHELAHLKVENHNESFWALVGEHDPAFSEHAEWLEENSTRLIFSSEDL